MREGGEGGRETVRQGGGEGGREEGVLTFARIAVFMLAARGNARATSVISTSALNYI